MDVLALYREEGGRLITIGSDGHKPIRILPGRVEVWDFVEENDFVLWEPSPGFWTRGAATGVRASKQSRRSPGL